ncbi:MAG: penicillin acylase family protein, partial [Planctomycetota bacterium]
MRRCIAFSVLLVTVSYGCGGGGGTSSGGGAVPEPRAAEILWDTRGVPHIFADNEEDLFYAFGWAQMHSHADSILWYYAITRGEACAYLANGDPTNDALMLTCDVLDRSLRIYEEAPADYAAQPESFRANLDAFALGMTEYAESHRGEIDDSLEALLPLTGIDVVAGGKRRNSAPLLDSRGIQFTVDSWIGSAAPSPAGTATASNGWAVAPDPSGSPHAMLLANPHGNWTGSILTEAHLSTPSMNLYGATLVGSPVFVIGFNDHLGWTVTTNYPNVFDAYELTLKGDTYLFDGSYRPLTVETETIRVRRADGSVGEHSFELYRSVHGPIMKFNGARDKALAIRTVATDTPAMLQQHWDMSRARNLAEFETALSRLQISYSNIVYADREGNILYFFGARVPVRPAGPWDWTGIVPGDTSATLWDGAIVAYEDLPRVVNPGSGWLQNGNDAAWTCTLPPPISPADFPDYLLHDQGMGFRPQRSARLLSENPPATLQELIDHKWDMTSELAERILDDLAAAVAAYAGDPGVLARAQEGLQVLNAWDRTTDAASRGGVLFDTFVGKWDKVTDV